MSTPWVWNCPSYVHWNILQEMTMNDEIITALRATKEKLGQETGFDVERLITNIQQEKN